MTIWYREGYHSQEPAMEYPIVLIPYTSYDSSKKDIPSMKNKTYTVVLSKPQHKPGVVKMYLLPKVVVDFNKTHGKTYVV